MLYYCINNRASDIAVLKLCSGITISKLLVLLEQGSEDSMNIAFRATSLYFLNTFLCSHNTDNTTSEGCVTVLWIDIFSFSFLVLCMFSIRFNIVQNTWNYHSNKNVHHMIIFFVKTIICCNVSVFFLVNPNFLSFCYVFFRNIGLCGPIISINLNFNCRIVWFFHPYI